MKLDSKNDNNTPILQQLTILQNISININSNVLPKHVTVFIVVKRLKVKSFTC